jgi:hypothetical protein
VARPRSFAVNPLAVPRPFVRSVGISEGAGGLNVAELEVYEPKKTKAAEVGFPLKSTMLALSPRVNLIELSVTALLFVTSRTSRSSS